MGRNILNEGCKTNVYVNTNFTANLPIEITQTDFNNPMTVALKGLNGLGNGGQIIQMNASGTQFEYANNTQTDTTLEKNFGTAVVGGNIIKLGNSANSGQSTNVEIFTSSVLNINNTSGQTVATFTPVTSTCDLDLKGGYITTATLGNNTIWDSNIPIAYNKGGTGLTSLTANQILQVNNSATGYNLIPLPTSITYSAQTPLSLNGTQFELGTVPYNKGGTGLSSLTGNATKILQVKLGLGLRLFCSLQRSTSTQLPPRMTQLPPPCLKA